MTWNTGFDLLMREQLCPYGKYNLKCPIKKCVLQDAELINFIRHFVFKPEISSLPLIVIRNMESGRKKDLLNGLWYCLPDKMSRAILVIEFFLDYLRIDKQHGKLMSKAICADIRALRRRFDRFIREKD